MAVAARQIEEARHRLAAALGVPSAFPWQLELLDRMLVRDLPAAVDIPTGLGKTAVIAVWLVALAAGAEIARRMVYVVDRRAVVDQATAVAQRLRDLVDHDGSLKAALGLEPHQSLAISTLRGRFVDNRQWLADPSAPAIVVGTVDMIGSRLLFEGYGVSRGMRPYHAGLLGADSLIVLDEAHLVPPFAHLLRTISRAAEHGLGADGGDVGRVVPGLGFIALSATGSPTSAANTIQLGDADRADPQVARRLAAKKALVIRPEVAPAALPERLAAEAWSLAGNGSKPVRCIVFCHRRIDAQAVVHALVQLAAPTQIDERIELFVGSRRIWERERVAKWLSQHGFLPGDSRPLEGPVFVIATSAGEVGVDLDADHMVSDLVAWERMVQRLGRVNRRGKGAATVIVVPANLDTNSDGDGDGEDDDDEVPRRLAAVRELLQELPRGEGDALDASPGALTALKQRAATDDRVRSLIAVGSTPEPLYPPLTRPLLESWSMTSLEEHTGRPQVEPWIRGWISRNDTQTTIVWREHLPLTGDGELLPPRDLEAFLGAAGPHLAEQLETETRHVRSWLVERVRTLRSRATSAPSGSIESGTVTTAGDGASDPTGFPLPDQIVAVIIAGSTKIREITARRLLNKTAHEALDRDLVGATVLVDLRIGGLENGLLKEASDTAIDVTSERHDDGTPVVPIRVQRIEDPDDEEVREELRRLPRDEAIARRRLWRREARIAIARTPDGDDSEWLVIDSLVTEPAESEEGRSVGPGRAQLLDEHEEWAETAARRLAERLRMAPQHARVLALAARLHDEGKRAQRWQQAFRAPGNGVYAKTRARPDLRLLARYRHELGSLPRAERDPRVQALDHDLRDLCLHLIASHHGHARPLLRTDGAEEPPSRLADRAQDIALRFARLEKRWGPWGLAWWEALLRAADQQASRANDEAGSDG